MNFNFIAKTFLGTFLTLFVFTHFSHGIESDEDLDTKGNLTRDASSSWVILTRDPLLPKIEVTSSDSRIRQSQVNGRKFQNKLRTLSSIKKALNKETGDWVDDFINYANCLRHVPLTRGEDTDLDSLPIQGALLIYQTLLEKESIINTRQASLCHLGIAKINCRSSDRLDLRKEEKREILDQAHKQAILAREKRNCEASSNFVSILETRISNLSLTPTKSLLPLRKPIIVRRQGRNLLIVL